MPHEGECVVCFVDRMTRSHGCSGHLTWATLWRDRCAPRATALERRLGGKGGFCDCEVLMNAFKRRDDFRSWIGEIADPGESADAELPCVGVRKGSSQACPRWIARRRGLW